MTLAMALLLNGADRISSFVFVSDSRLTISASASRYFYDDAIKVIDLSPRTAVAMAGAGTLPTRTAVDCVRPAVAYGEKQRREAGLPPLSVWDEAANFLAWLEPAYARYSQVFANLQESCDCHVLLGGFLRCGAACVFEFELHPTTSHIRVYVPPVGKKAGVAIGDTQYVPYLKQAYEDHSNFHAPVSVLWDIVKHQGAPTAGVGGGVSLTHGRSEWPQLSWPTIQIDGETFTRGLCITPSAPLNSPQALQIKYDPHLFASLEKRAAAGEPLGQMNECQDMSFQTGNFVVGDLYRRLCRFEPEDEWVEANVDPKLWKT
jgi:hypothetical protein